MSYLLLFVLSVVLSIQPAMLKAPPTILASPSKTLMAATLGE